uniref:ABC transporter ATP-binding protein n=1 Tax=Thermofilum pendens TaxID=2269 RepID=A0A7J3X9P6_THEPE
MMVRVSGLSYRYPGSESWVLRDMHFEADAGEFILLVGPSGCGKSTFARVLNGLIPHFYGGELLGEVEVCGMDPREHPTYEFAECVGFVFQNPENQLFFTSVERELAFGLENLGLPREEISRRVEQALREYQLAELRDRSPYELSGGQQQRLAIASVMVMQPRVLVLDEPTANLDPFTAARILALVRRKTIEEGVAAIVIEHRLEVALPFATRMVVMVDGQVVDDGHPVEVIARQKHIVGKPRALELVEHLAREGIYLEVEKPSPEHVALSIVRAYRVRKLAERRRRRDSS